MHSVSCKGIYRAGKEFKMLGANLNGKHCLKDASKDFKVLESQLKCRGWSTKCMQSTEKGYMSQIAN